MKKVFVTGGTGFLGINLIDALLATKRYSVTALHRKNSDLRHLKKRPVRLVEGSILDQESLLSGMDDQTDFVFHVAANTNMWAVKNSEQTRDNVEGTRNVVQVCLKKNAGRMIHTSSIAAFGMYDGQKIDENFPSNAKDSEINYIRTKYLAEMEVISGIEKGLNAVFLNPGHIMGPYDTHNWASLIKMVVNKSLPAVPGGSGSFCHVYEVAKAHVAAAEKGRIGERYLLGGNDASYQDVVSQINKMTGVPYRVRTLPRSLMTLYGQVSYLYSLFSKKEPEVTPEKVIMTSSHMTCHSNKAVRELNYQTTSLQTMVRDCYLWMQKEQYI